MRQQELSFVQVRTTYDAYQTLTRMYETAVHYKRYSHNSLIWFMDRLAIDMLLQAGDLRIEYYEKHRFLGIDVEQLDDRGNRGTMGLMVGIAAAKHQDIPFEDYQEECLTPIWVDEPANMKPKRKTYK